MGVSSQICHKIHIRNSRLCCSGLINEQRLVCVCVWEGRGGGETPKAKLAASCIRVPGVILTVNE